MSKSQPTNRRRSGLWRNQSRMTRIMNRISINDDLIIINQSIFYKLPHLIILLLDQHVTSSSFYYYLYYTVLHLKALIFIQQRAHHIPFQIRMVFQLETDISNLICYYKQYFSSAESINIVLHISLNLFKLLILRLLPYLINLLSEQIKNTLLIHIIP